MLFEEHTSEIKLLKKLQQVWVRSFGILNEIRSFLPLWAGGSILRATQKVDMSYLRKTGVVRLLVAVLDAMSFRRMQMLWYIEACMDYSSRSTKW
jgi:hypothetical protein